jgi:hypothetical protein
MKILLVTLAIGKKYLYEYNRLFRKSQELYARKHGYDFKVITDFLGDLRHTYAISFNKILVCSQEWSSQYDFIIFVDADILINPNSPPIPLDCGEKIGMVDEWSQPTKEGRQSVQTTFGWEKTAIEHYKLCGFDLETDVVLNSGVLVMQPKLHGQFLRNIYDKYVLQSIDHPRGYVFEQTCIGYELQKAQMYKLLDKKWNSVWGITHHAYKCRILLKVFFQQTYFLHFAGGGGVDKISRTFPQLIN